MIRYLSQEEKAWSRKLWEEAFPEDSQGFVDFYYGERVRENKILAVVEDGEIAAMLHRNPYMTAVKDQVWRIDYIAGVATAFRQRRKGHMRRLLIRLFKDLYLERMGFCFLVPANPKLYHSFGFAYICDLPERVLREREMKNLKPLACMDRPGGCREAAALAKEVLKKNYEVYVVRDEEYYQSLCREVRSDDGELFLLYSQDNGQAPAGILAYYGETGEELREFLSLPKFQKEAQAKAPWAMGRIIHLARFMQVISLKEDCKVSEMELLLQVRDEYICENDGLFCWRLNREGSSLSRVNPEAADCPWLSLGICELTEWLFGYRMPAVPKGQQELVQCVRTLQGVYFDEIT